MKRRFIVPSILMCFCINTQAQITLQSEWVATIGDSIFLWQDTIHGLNLNLGAAAGNQQWDFSSLEPQLNRDALIEAPSTAPFASNFPEADFVINDLVNDSSHVFLKSTSTYLDLVGIVEYDDAGNPELPEGDIRLRIIEFPSTMGDSYTAPTLSFVQVDSINFDPDGGGPHPNVDSLRAKLNFMVYSEIDAWGDLILPNGTYESIRQRFVNYLKIGYDFYGNGTWQPFTPELIALLGDSVAYDTNEVSYRWWSNNSAANFMLAEVRLDSAGAPDSTVDWFAAAPSAPAGVGLLSGASNVSVFPNPATTVVKLSRNSSALAEVVLMDAMGHVVKRETMTTGTHELSVEGLAEGVYLMQMLDEHGRLMHADRVVLAR